jgi:hypothetical protein
MRGDGNPDHNREETSTMAFKTLAAVSAGVLLLAGCNSGLKSDQEWTAIHNAIAAELKTCESAVINKPEYASLLPHTFWSSTVPASELANDTLPTPEEAHGPLQPWSHNLGSLCPRRPADFAGRRAPN